MQRLSIKYQKGFTLIELLVVIAIIGILASVVLASLNSARIKGQIAAIKSNLKNMQSQAELAYDAPGNYSALATCALDPGISKMASAITTAGGTVSCYSYTGTGDVYTRWGASARLNSDNTQNFSVDSTGVVTWDTADKPASDWDTANANCAATGGRLPSIEELKALFLAYSSTTPPSFVASYYWSGTTNPANSTRAYEISMYGGFMDFNGKAGSIYVRCVH